MTNNYPSDLPPQDSAAGLNSGGFSSTDLDYDAQADTGPDAREQASELAGKAADAGKNVAGVAKEETKKVAAETGAQAKNLVREAGKELKEQAAVQQSRVAEGLRSVGNELSSMAEKSETSGMATDLVQQVSSRATSVAEWLDAREPGSLLEEVKGFARQRPGVFIALAAGAGLLAGRLTRALVEPAGSDSGSSSAPGSGSRTADTSTTIDGAPAADLPVYGSLTGDVIAGEVSAPGVQPTGGL